ncbi:hypothetical protein AG1IA_08114 [Rhizoctonia solani AG-1 IA]|uniref:Uncharacterized protein n=1 Tax=Thanatephorus cucumeris (strain AG1-IA) TaxID=983506 RepID=L8WIX2_THACA|nr:hypothetical protein AG1IA_08114 [Rhizoctonia solani AG-1 IA]
MQLVVFFVPRTEEQKSAVKPMKGLYEAGPEWPLRGLTAFSPSRVKKEAKEIGPPSLAALNFRRRRKSRPIVIFRRR